jgi:hypothetical protein
MNDESDTPAPLERTLVIPARGVSLAGQGRFGRAGEFRIDVIRSLIQDEKEKADQSSGRYEKPRTEAAKRLIMGCKWGRLCLDAHAFSSVNL